MLWDALLPAGREGLWQLSLSLCDSFIPLAAPCLSLQWSCTGSPGDPESLAQKLQEGGRELVSRNTAQLRASLRKNLGKEENIFKKGKKKKVGRVSEARCLSCLVGWKPAGTICLTVKRESNPPTKLVRVALGPKKELPYCV